MQISIVPQYEKFLTTEPMECLSWVEKTAYIAYQLKVLDDQTEAPLKHIFEPRMYIREMSLPANVMLVGRPHTFGHRCQLVSGSLLHVTENDRRVVDAPFDLHTVPCMQIVIYTFTPVVARTYHPNVNEERDIATLESKWFMSPEPILKLGEMVHSRLKAITQS